MCRSEQDEGLFYLKKLSLAMNLLDRIKKIYPHIFGECITEEDIKRQPSMPCETNAITEAIWEKAFDKFKREKRLK